MTLFSSGKHAFGICDRCGFRTRLNSMKEEVVARRKTGVMVCQSCFDPDHPQLDLGRVRVQDPQALRNARPDTDPGRGLYGWDPVGNPAQAMEGQVGTVTVEIGE